MKICEHCKQRIRWWQIRLYPLKEPIKHRKYHSATYHYDCFFYMLLDSIRGKSNTLLGPKWDKTLKKKEPIYEKLAPGEDLIISKDENGCLEVAENINGKIEIRTVCPMEEKP